VEAIFPRTSLLLMLDSTCPQETQTRESSATRAFFPEPTGRLFIP
jgi:hypothetical protein